MENSESRRGRSKGWSATASIITTEGNSSERQQAYREELARGWGLSEASELFIPPTTEQRKQQLDEEVILWAHQTTWTTELTAEAEYENDLLENAAFRD